MNADLIAKATEARERALAPYSGLKIGAAIETRNGETFTGCNIENASYSLTMCAERVALLKALSEGAREFRELVIVSDAEELTSPCGACRQLLWEYCGDITIYMQSLKGSSEEYPLSELFPLPFDRRNLRT